MCFYERVRDDAFRPTMRDLMKLIALAISCIFLAAASGARAQENCIAPYAPVIPDGTAVNEEEILEIRDQITAFLNDSKSYQDCLAVSLRQMQEDARRANKQVDQRLRTAIVTRINSSMERQIEVGEEFNVAVRAFNARFPAETETATPGG